MAAVRAAAASGAMSRGAELPQESPQASVLPQRSSARQAQLYAAQVQETTLPHVVPEGISEDGALMLRPDEAGEVVHGVPISNESLALAIRRVIILSSVVATYYICSFISSLLMGMYGRSSGSPSELWSGLSELAIELSIPACGYYGALYAHRTLIFFFCGANLVFIVASAIGFFRLLVVLSSSSRNMCQQEYASAKSTCEIMLGDGPEKYMLLSSIALLTVLGCLSFMAGKKLYQGLHPFDLSSMPSGSERAPLVGEVIASGLNFGAAAQGLNFGAAPQSLVEAQGQPAVIRRSALGAAAANASTPELSGEPAAGRRGDVVIPVSSAPRFGREAQGNARGRGEGPAASAAPPFTSSDRAAPAAMAPVLVPQMHSGVVEHQVV